MSTTIDKRVVEMRFDNRQFEKNVSTTMSTLEKLKQKLNFTGAAKGLEDLGATAKKTNLSGLVSAAETVGLKFNAMYTIADQALRNITNSAMLAGKRIVNSLTLDPIKTGFNEYELKMNSIQTIMASTGEELEVVNKYLNELNEYSDKTIYSFSDMTQNIGKFTNAGVKLEDAVLAMKGISNEAAVSGANANEASRAMYNFAQALSVGYIQRIDWKSIELANMATMEFKEQLLNAAIEMGTVTKTAEGMYATFANPDKLYNASAMFTETLDDQWLTTEVLIGTLKDYADETTEIGAKATKAATEVKTFTQMMDALKESAQSGWARTWEIIFGDFYEGKELWTSMYKAIDGLLGKMNDARNSLLDNVFSSKWDKLSSQIEKAGLSTENYLKVVEEVAKENGVVVKDLINEYGDLKTAISKGKIPANVLTKALKKLLGAEDDLKDSTKGVTKSLEECKKIVDKVIEGAYGNGEKRMKALTEAGYDYATVQNLVNEKLGISYRHISKLTEEQKNNATQLAKLSDEQLKNKGYTEDQIEALRELQKAAEEGGTSINDLINSMEKPSGRELVIESFANVCKYFGEVLGIVGDAWDKTFGDIDLGSILYNAIEQIHKFTESLTISEEAAGNFKKVFEGLFAVLQLNNWFFSASLSAGLKLFNNVLSLFGTNLANVITLIADYVLKFRDWMQENATFSKTMGGLSDIIYAVINGVKRLVDAFWSLEKVQEIVGKVADKINEWFGVVGEGLGVFKFDAFIKAIDNFFNKLVTWVNTFDSKSWEEIGSDIVNGLLKGLGSGFDVVAKIASFAWDMITAFCEVMGIRSPSREFFEIGTNIILGLVNGLQNGLSLVIEAVLTLGEKVVEVIKSLDFGKIFAIVTIISITKVLKSIADSMEILVGPIKGVNKVLGSFSGMLDSFAKRNKAKTFKDIAISIGILVASLIALTYVISDEKMANKLWAALVTIGALAGIMYALAVAMEKMNGASASFKDGKFNLEGFKQGLIQIGAAILMMAVAVKLIGEMDEDKVNQGFWTMVLIAGTMVALYTVLGELTKKGSNFEHAGQVGKMLTKMAVSMLLMIAVVKLAGTLTQTEITNGIAFVTAFALFSSFMIQAVGTVAGKQLPKVGTTLVAMTFAMLMLIAVVKLVGMLSDDDITKGFWFVVAFGAFVWAIVKILDSVEKELPKFAGVLLAMTTSMLLLVVVTKLVGMLESKDIVNGITFGALFLIFAKFLIQVINTIDKDAPKIAGTLLSLSLAVGMLALIAVLLSTINPLDLLKGVAAVGALSYFMAIMVNTLKGAQNIKGSLIVLTVAVGIMAAAVALLSFIKPEDLIPATLAMMGLMYTFSLMIQALKVAKGVNKALPALAAIVVVVGVLAGILWLLKDLPIESTLGTSVSLAALLLSLTGVLAILSAIGPAAKLADAAMVALAKLVAGVAIVVTALGLLAQIPGFKTVIADGGEMLGLIGYAIGNFVGSIIGGFTAGATSGLPAVGENLSKFMENIGGFITGAAGIKEDALTGVQNLAKMMLMLTGSSFLESIKNFIFGSGSLDTFAKNLDSYGNAIIAFSDKVKGKIDESSIMAAANAGKMLAEMQATIGSTGGIFQMFTGVKDLSGFGEQLKSYGQAICDFSNALVQNGGINETAIIAAANAGKVMSELQSSIAPMGGVLQAFTGDKDLFTFGQQLKAYGEAIVAFSTAVSKEGAINESAIIAAKNAGMIMAELQSAIEPTKGVLQAFTGDVSLDSFGYQMQRYGEGLAAFSKAVTGENTIDEAAITAAANAGKVMAEVQASIPENKLFDGKMDLADFGYKMQQFGGYVKAYSDAVIGIDTDKVTTSTTTARQLIGIAKSASSLDADNIANFEEIGTIAKVLRNYYDKVSEIDYETITASTKSIQRLLSMVNSLAFIDDSGVKSFKNALTALAKIRIAEIAPAFQEASENLMNYFTKGITLSKNNVSSAMLTNVSTALNGIAIYYTSFYNAGVSLVSGFTQGIEDMADDAANAAAAMAKSAYEAAKQALDVNSPSKIFRSLGYSVPEGFVMGIDKLSGMVTRSATGMAGAAIDGVKSSISRIAEMVDGNIDAQPTIRPVLDLSNIRSGVGTMNDLLGVGASVGVLSNVGAISSAMAGYGQNGGNADVVSALNKLRKDLGKVGGNTYNVNGVTYDDGSNVSDAVKELVRAAKIERRV